MAKQATPKKVFSVELKLGDDVLKAEGETVLDAMKAVHPAREVGPMFFNTKGHLKGKREFIDEKGKKVTRIGELLMSALQLRRCFNKFENYTVMKIWSKKLEVLIG